MVRNAVDGAPRTVDGGCEGGDAGKGRAAARLHLEVRTLRYFLEFVRAGSVVAAAETLHLTQPTLSRQLNSLEAQVGCALWSRSGRHVRLTEKGRMLYGYARSVVELVDRAERDLTADSELAGSVFVGYGDSAGMELVVKAMERTHRAHPGVHFHTYVGSTLDLFERLDAGTLDFVLECEVAERPGYGCLPMPEGDRWGILMRDDMPLAALDAVGPCDLEGKPVMLSRQALKVGVIERWAGESFARYDLVATFNAGTTAFSLMARCGAAYVFTYEGLVPLGGEDGLCFRPLEPRMYSSSGMIWRKNRTPSGAAQAFLDELHRMLGERGAE